MPKILQLIISVLNVPLLPVGHTVVTLASLLYILILCALLIAVSRSFRRRVLERLLEKSKLDRNMQNAFALLLQYSIIGIGMVIILNTAGIEMGALTVLAGAMGIGLSLGMQTIAKNVAGGIMILVERPIRIGDRITIGTTCGDVTNIALRATTIRNDDHIDIIVPNSDFMDQRVSNWTYSTRDVIVNIPIIVSCDNDISIVKEILKNSAKGHPKVLDEPPPEILLDSFEGGKLKFIIRVATNDYVSASINLKSEINNEVLRQFKDSQIKLDAAK
jgi:small-conductance mechanosensitive channel